MDYMIHGIFLARILEWVVVPFSRRSSNPGIKHRSPALQADSLPAEPPGKSKNIEVGKSYPLQYSGLENSMDCTVHGVTKNWTQVSDFPFYGKIYSP